MWQHLTKYNADHCVVLHSLAFNEDEPLLMPILSDITMQKVNQASFVDSGETSGYNSTKSMPLPTSHPELKTYLDERIRGCIMNVLYPWEPRTWIAGRRLGNRLSVMAAILGREMQKTSKAKVPPTLTWGDPTVGRLFL